MKRSCLIASGILSIAAFVLLSSREQGIAQQTASPESARPREYLLIEEGMATFQKKVNEKMREGFTPQGGVSVTRTESGYQMQYQAMVR